MFTQIELSQNNTHGTNSAIFISDTSFNLILSLQYFEQKKTSSFPLLNVSVD
jgi:hypothetical protein